MNNVNQGLVSIIIPLHVITERFSADLKKFSRLHYKHYELLVVSDVSVSLQGVPKVRLILTGKTGSGPAEKRDIGLHFSQGEFCAFIDDDAYPDPNWLTQAVFQFKKRMDVIGIGGPGITPPHESYMAKLGGYIYESLATSGLAQHRFVARHQKERYTEDWPAYNLLVRTEILRRVHGYDCTFYGGEDTFLCLKLIKYGKILYDPKVIVYHHRRALFIPHLKQIYNVGVHRGYFFKKFPKTSRKMFYILPTVLTVGFWAALIISFLHLRFMPYFLGSFLAFFLLAFVSVFRKTSPLGAVLVTLGIIFTHMAYGLGFLQGLFVRSLTR